MLVPPGLWRAHEVTPLKAALPPYSYSPDATGSVLGCSPPASEGGKGPGAGTTCSPTPRCSLLYGQALHKIKGTSSSLSFLNIILAQRCAHVRKSV